MLSRRAGLSAIAGLSCFLFICVLLDWSVQCFTSPPTQYRLYGRRFYRSKDPTNSISTNGAFPVMPSTSIGRASISLYVGVGGGHTVANCLLPSPPSSLPFLTSLPLEVGFWHPARRHVERCKFPVPAGAKAEPQRRIWHILALKYDISWQQL